MKSTPSETEFLFFLSKVVLYVTAAVFCPAVPTAVLFTFLSIMEDTVRVPVTVAVISCKTHMLKQSENESLKLQRITDPADRYCTKTLIEN